MSDQSPNPLADKLRLFIDIARMRRGPDDLPFDRALLAGTVFAYALLNLLFALMLPRQAGQPVALALIAIAVTLLALRLLLVLARKPERFVQTATAMFGFQIALAPALLLTAWLFIRYGEDSTWQLPAAMLRFAVEVWVLAVTSRILRSSTEWPLAACVALAIALELLTYLIIMLFYPQALAVPAPT